MKEQFKEINFREDRLDLIAKADKIIVEYEEMGLRLTLRQLYYQFVTKNWIVNNERSYKRLGELVSDGRLAGLLDWDAIEDRVRVPRFPSEFANLKELTDAALHSYRLPRWAGQGNYVELWVEKDALAGVLQPLATEYHVTLMVNRGYSSQSAMFSAGKRFARADDNGQNPHLLYLGDHDPSGEDMVRDVRDRLAMFGVTVAVKKVALNMDQVRHYNPPPNPAKLTDSRSAGYVAKHGDESWEVDALPPQELTNLIQAAIRPLYDPDKMEVIKERERRDKVQLTLAVSKLAGK